MAVHWLGIAALVAAFGRGDLDEVSRLGRRVGPVVVEHALDSPTTAVRLAGIAATRGVDDGIELLPALGRLAASEDHTVALAAVDAARAIARAQARRELADDLAPEDLGGAREVFEAIALTRDRTLEVRLAAADTAHELARALSPTALGIDLGAALADPDAAFRAGVLALVPQPTPPALRARLVSAIASDAENAVVVAAAQALCADLAIDDPTPIRALLDVAAKDHLRAALATDKSPAARDAARCLR